jgi:hypothetical protein
MKPPATALVDHAEAYTPIAAADNFNPEYRIQLHVEI